MIGKRNLTERRTNMEYLYGPEEDDPDPDPDGGDDDDGSGR